MHATLLSAEVIGGTSELTLFIRQPVNKKGICSGAREMFLPPELLQN